ncbi:MAG: hypothetical protein ACYC2J_00350 [Acidithiobacillus ferrooxidans]
MPSLEVHIPLSPTPMFLRQLWIQVQSFRRFGGKIARRAEFHVWVSPDTPVTDLKQQVSWSRDPAVHFHWIGAELFAEHWYYGTALARGDWEFQSDLVAFLDADVLAAGSLDDLLEDVLRNPAVVGFQAHVDVLEKDPETGWERLFAHLGLPAPERTEFPTGVGLLPDVRPSPLPVYWNLGVVLGTNALMRQLGDDLVGELPGINSFFCTIYRCQIAVAVRLARLRLPFRQLDVRYNYPNIPSFDDAHIAALPDIRLLHYLHHNPGVDKDRDFDTPEHYDALLHRPGLAGSNLLLQQRLRALGPYPGDPWRMRWRQRWPWGRRR